MSVKKRKNSPFWYTNFTFHNIRYRISTGETERRAAQIVEAEMIADLRRAPDASASWTISQIMGCWWDEHARHTKSADAIWSNIQNIERCLNVAAAIDKLTNAMLMDFRAKRRGEGVQPPTINRDLAYFQAACRHCTLIHKQPAPDVHWSKLKYRENPARHRFAAQDEFAVLMAAADSELRDVILFATLTGLRRGNVLPLEWYQIDLSGKMATIATTKSGQGIIIDLAGPVIEMLLRRRRDAAKARGGIPTGKIFDTKNWRRRWNAARRDAGMIDFRWHDLRHTFGTWARKSGVDLPTLQQAMTHKDIKTTMRYAHVTAEETTSAFAKVAERMAQLTAHPKINLKKTGD